MLIKLSKTAGVSLI